MSDTPGSSVRCVIITEHCSVGKASCLCMRSIQVCGRSQLPDHNHGQGRAKLGDLALLRDRILPQVANPIQFPEPALSLDLESRRDSELRMFKHLHQSSVLHREHFCASSQIKHMYLIDAYLDLASSRNGLGLYIVARTMLEFSAFLHEISTRLLKAAARAGDSWRDAGEMFFGLVVRARFATTREDYQALLREAGLAERHLKPFHVMDCIRSLAKDDGNADVQARYDTLCDFVHHNLASATTANAGSAEAQMAFSSVGGAITVPRVGTITQYQYQYQYQYPIPSKFDRALDDTGSGFLHDAQACVRWINQTPGSPYPPEMVERITGTAFGVPMLHPPKQRSNPY